MLYRKWITLPLAIVCATFIIAFAPLPSIRTSFYTAMMGEDTLKINACLRELHSSSLPEKEAFEGTLYMKKAGLVKGINTKLDMFKKGHIILEDEIKKQSSNVEYRFCRLMIQENAPRILGYRSEIDEDADMLKKHFNKLDAEAKASLKSYSKKSKSLKGLAF